jgi:hypothetical protein
LIKVTANDKAVKEIYSSNGGRRQYASILMMLLVGFSGYLNPADHHILANAGLAFPLFLLITSGSWSFGLSSNRKAC